MGRLQHHEQCTQKRCHSQCDIVIFHAGLNEPLLLVDVRRAELEQQRLAALMKGDIPEAV